MVIGLETNEINILVKNDKNTIAIIQDIFN